MVSGRPPFMFANPDDYLYSLIKDKDFDEFWKKSSNGMPRGIDHFSNEVKSLI